MPNAKSVILELRKLANPLIAEKSQSFFKTGKGEYGEGDLFLGLRVPVIRKVAKMHSDIKVSEALKLVRSKYHEERLTGLIILVNQFRCTANKEEQEQIYRSYVSHFRYINNWDLIDVTCHKIIGPYLEGKRRTILYQWAKSKNLWVRRIAIISTFHFIRQGDLKDSFAIAEVLLRDPHDLIHKAVGWVLRECGKKNQKALEAFLKKHYKKMPRTMLRYSIERFAEPKRLQYLKNEV